MEIIKLGSGDKADELREKIIDLINNYSNVLNGYEILGVIDVIREDTHISLSMDEEDGKKDKIN